MPLAPETTLPLARVRELSAGDRVIGFYLLTKLEIKPKRNGGNYLELKLQDSSGTLDAKMWEGFEQLANELKPGQVVKLDGQLDRYKDVPGLILSRIRVATDEEAPNPRDFLPHSFYSETELHHRLVEIIGSVESPGLRKLLENIFEDASFLALFLQASGGKLWHHATIGGLAEHSTSMARLVSRMAEFYPDLQRDLIVTGALLHDVGKVFELGTEISIDYTVEGRLLGHITQGVLFVEKHVAAIPDFPEETRRQLLHLILSHQGDGTMGSPVKPMTLDALVLHYCDELDSRVDAFRTIRARTPAEQPFSDYVKLMERFFYFQPVDSHDESENP